MADWMIEIENELRRGRQSQNPGRTRTVARRIAGIAIQELQSQFSNLYFGEDYYRALQAFMNADEIPAPVAEAARRLQERLTPDFTSPSIDPIGDAMMIVEFVKIRCSKK
jgi:hypothetical protein